MTMYQNRSSNITILLHLIDLKIDIVYIWKIIDIFVIYESYEFSGNEPLVLILDVSVILLE